ncbi:MarR family transcriptional regulator [Gordonia sp. NB41Y]|nr:MarR family transcriptional regulator [Gordonia sp. NB41Y]EMP15305.2 hypothetical protein ISGA_3987 [Gordonia sp. NB41Y]WLP89722.1 MarR family transcriptional regulator [Gordonia sp. NB41Y]
MFVLMAESREMSTPEIKAVAPEPKRPDRAVLVGHGLIEVRKGARNALFHTLTDRGWVWCAAELRDGPPARSLPPIRALYTVLDAVGRYLGDEDLRLHEVFGRPRRSDDVEESRPTPTAASGDDNEPTTPAVPPGDLIERVIEAYHRIAPRPGALVSVRDIRAALDGIVRTDLDTALVTLQRRPGVSLIPQEDQALLTDAERAAAVLVGTQPCHLLSLEED